MPYKLTWLPDVLIAAGLKVAECPGWKTCGVAEMGTVEGVLCHHTATTHLKGNMPSLNTLIHGRTGTDPLPGPLAQLGLGRDGTFYIISAGRCNHAGPGLWKGIQSGNSHFIGIEAENTGNNTNEQWPTVQIEAYQRGVAAILNYVRQSADYCAGHKEYRTPAGTKHDPNFDMGDFRKKVATFMLGNVPPSLIPAAEMDNLLRKTLRRGILNDAELVKIVQQKTGIAVDGFFGPKTEAAVRQFQSTKNAVPDGIVGPKTWALIDVE
jgi:peptidoglycan hydrolase-like protein with peptidoglycan-binding domain